MPEELLYCETCKAHIETATYHGTVLEEGIDRNGEGTGFYAIKRQAFCARCKPDHDIVIVRRDHFTPIHLDTETRMLVDPSSKALVAQVTADAVIDALAAVAEALAGGDAEALDEAQAAADTTRTEATSADEFPAQPAPPPVSERRAPLT